MLRSDETLHAGQGDGVVIPIRPPQAEPSTWPPQPLRGHRSRFAELTSQDFRNEAQRYRAMAGDAPMGWIQNEFIRIAAGLDRVADEKEATEKMRPRNLAEFTPDQLHGLERAYRDLGASATTDWTRRSFDRIADELARRAGAVIAVGARP